jgi:hypothetical protein
MVDGGGGWWMVDGGWWMVVTVVVVLMALVPPVVRELNQEEEEETKREENHPIPCQVLIIDHSEGTRHICSPHSSTCRNYDELHDDERSRRQWGANVWVLGASSLLTFITFIT